MERGWVAIVAAAVVLVLVWIWARGLRREMPAEQVGKGPAVNMDAEMEWLAEKAVERAQREFGVTLNRSQESIEQIEEVLGKIHEQHQMKPFAEGQVAEEAWLWGAYIGEVIKKDKPGQWQRDSHVAGPNTRPLVFDSQNETYPCAWVWKRIQNGPEDNVWHKYVLLFRRDKLEPLILDGEHGPGKKQ